MRIQSCRNKHGELRYTLSISEHEAHAVVAGDTADLVATVRKQVPPPDRAVESLVERDLDDAVEALASALRPERLTPG